MLNAILDSLGQMQDKPRLLVVDDQPINIRAVNEVFKDDFEILMATSGEKALQQARQNKPDIILLDVVMPGMSGHEVCRALKADPVTEAIPVIFVTSQTEDAEEAYGFEIGAVDFITKPINPVIVRARVRTQLALKLQYDFVRNMALLDGLTGIPNRRRFDEELTNLWRLCLREQRPLSLMLMDVDFFKRYNDHYGHIAGDECLRQIASALQSTLRRPSDLVCRYGGEEFACLLPFTDAEGACDRARAILQAVTDRQIPHEASEAGPCVSISIGVVSLMPDDNGDPEAILALADKALYLSKEAGRARFTLHKADHEQEALSGSAKATG